MGTSASLTFPPEYEKLTAEEKSDFQKKFEARVADGTVTPEAAFTAIYKESLEFIATLQSSDKYNIEHAKIKLAEINAAEEKVKNADKFAFVGGVPIAIVLTDLEMAIEKALNEGLTPLIVDNSEDNKVDTYFSYGNGFLLDSKKLGLDRSMKKVPLKDLMEEARAKLVSSLRYGNRLIIAMTKSCTDFNGVFSDESPVKTHLRLNLSIYVPSYHSLI